MTRVLRPAGNLANTEGRTGSFNLKITLDEHNRLIGCDTQINRKFDPKLYPYNAKLAVRPTVLARFPAGRSTRVISASYSARCRACSFACSGVLPVFGEFFCVRKRAQVSIVFGGSELARDLLIWLVILI